MNASDARLLERLCNIVRLFPERRILVVGDLVADQFLYGEINRVSREAPVLILRHERTETMPGAAANCAANLAALGARTAVVGLVGEDDAGNTLIEKLREASVEVDGVVASPLVKTTTKVRILAGHAHSPRQQVLRVDYEGATPAAEGLREELQARARRETAMADGVIVSDYNYDVADSGMAEVIRSGTCDRGVPVVIDSRFRLCDFAGFTSATPNEDEVEQLLRQKFINLAELEHAAAGLRAQLGYEALLVTRGSRGMMLLEPHTPGPLHLDAVGAREPVDGTGAGDTVIATYALALASGASYAEAARLANHAGGLVVMKRGTATVTLKELLSSLVYHDTGAESPESTAAQ